MSGCFGSERSAGGELQAMLAWAWIALFGLCMGNR